jgi:formylglycine-generating enzyme required for sulfatase activity
LLEQGEAKVGWFVKTVLDTLAASAIPKSKTGTKEKKKSDHPPLADEARCAGLLGAVFHDLLPTGYEPTEPRYHELLSRVMAIFDRDGSASVDIPTRIAAAEALGQVGDPRFELDAKSRWITIPAGPFHRGAQSTDPSGRNFDPDAHPHESPVHQVTLDSFQIARFPLTVGEYQRFVEHDGYSNKKFWSGGGFGLFTEPEDWEEQLPFKNRPVVGVSWYEASAYCQWSGHRLPTEAEWERAARGDTGRRYPWGPEPADETRLNFNTNIGRSTPVGIYPLGATPDGIEEMAGNVWEWCQDWYGPYETGEQLKPCGPEEAEHRVLRGGSWNDNSRYARSAIRNGLAPVNRLFSIGFRVVCCVRTS